MKSGIRSIGITTYAIAIPSSTLSSADDARVGEQPAHEPEIGRNLRDRADQRALGTRARRGPAALAIACAWPPAVLVVAVTSWCLQMNRPGVRPGVGVGGAAVGRSVVARATFRCAASTTSLATDLPAAATPDSTPIALFMSPMVSAIVDADTRPARSVSSTPSANRCSALGGLRRPLGVLRLEELDVVEQLISALVGQRLEGADDTVAKSGIHGRLIGEMSDVAPCDLPRWSRYGYAPREWRRA